MYFILGDLVIIFKLYLNALIKFVGYWIDGAKGYQTIYFIPKISCDII